MDRTEINAVSKGEGRGFLRGGVGLGASDRRRAGKADQGTGVKASMISTHMLYV